MPSEALRFQDYCDALRVLEMCFGVREHFADEFERLCEATGAVVGVVPDFGGDKLGVLLGLDRFLGRTGAFASLRFLTSSALPRLRERLLSDQAVAVTAELSRRLELAVDDGRTYDVRVHDQVLYHLTIPVFARFCLYESVAALQLADVFVLPEEADIGEWVSPEHVDPAMGSRFRSIRRAGMGFDFFSPPEASGVQFSEFEWQKYGWRRVK